MKQSEQYQQVKRYNHAYWAKQAKNKKRLIVFYGDDVLDLTEFGSKHPAGEKAIQCYILQDIKNILFRIYPHPKSAINVLQGYKCGKLLLSKEQHLQIHTQKGICKETSAITNKKQEHNKKVKFDAKQQKSSISSKQKCEKLQNRRTDTKYLNKKIQEDSLNLEQNKPTLMVPYFNPKFYWGRSHGGLVEKLN